MNMMYRDVSADTRHSTDFQDNAVCKEHSGLLEQQSLGGSGDGEQLQERNLREYKSFYKTVGGNEGEKCLYNTRFDVYGNGCQHDCHYCYGKHMLSIYGNWNVDEPCIADIRKIEKKIELLPKGSIVRLGGLTDCFQPLEKTERVTLETIKLLNKHGIGYLIVTKSSLIAEPEYIAVLDKDLAHIQISVTCLDDDIAGEYEKASPPSARIKALYDLQDAGFDVALRISPFIEEYMDFHLLNALKVDKCLIEFLRVNSWIKKLFRGVDYRKYTEKQSNYQHLPLEEKICLLGKVTLPNITVCEDVTEHYEYWRDNVNPNKTDCCNLRDGARVKIDPVFKALIPRLLVSEYAQLEENILSEGRCREPLIAWEGVLIDGHNRHEICLKHDIPFNVTDKHFDSKDDAMLWIITNQLGRRNLTDAMRIELATKKAEYLKIQARENQSLAGGDKRSRDSHLTETSKSITRSVNVRKAIAKDAGVSEDTVRKYGKVVETGTPELVAQVKVGAKKIGTAFKELLDEKLESNDSKAGLASNNELQITNQLIEVLHGNISKLHEHIALYGKEAINQEAVQCLQIELRKFNAIIDKADEIAAL